MYFEYFFSVGDVEGKKNASFFFTTDFLERKKTVVKRW